MAWQWAHGVEAYVDACANVHSRPREWLEVVYAEWKACKDPHARPDDFSKWKYRRALAHAKTLSDEVLADYIWERMEEYAVCTNGGHKAYGCPSGCSPHLVPFALEDDDDDDDDDNDDDLDGAIE